MCGGLTVIEMGEVLLTRGGFDRVDHQAEALDAFVLAFGGQVDCTDQASTPNFGSVTLTGNILAARVPVHHPFGPACLVGQSFLESNQIGTKAAHSDIVSSR